MFMILDAPILVVLLPDPMVYVAGVCCPPKVVVLTFPYMEGVFNPPPLFREVRLNTFLNLYGLTSWTSFGLKSSRASIAEAAARFNHETEKPSDTSWRMNSLTISYK